jgi:Cytochrome c554 and c-prime
MRRWRCQFGLVRICVHILCASPARRETVCALAAASLALLAIRCVAIAEKPAFAPPVPDPTRIVGADQCAKCHQKEVQQWMRTAHFATFDSLHRTPQAKQIADRLGLRSIKRSDVCTKCHYTEQNQGGRVRVVAGVSCESCHGGAADWLAIHADYGGINVTKQQETAEHRTTRLAESIAHGMNNPHNVYLIARQCFNCHTVPNESLVNVGGHVAGSRDFELVAWSQGIVRHNFLRTGGTANGSPGPAELRLMFVVGVMTDLEYSLRAAAVATEKSTFGVTSAQRAARMKQRLHEVQALIDEPLIQPALDAVAMVELRLENQAAIVAAADAVSNAAYKFAEVADGNKLAALDPLLPQPDQYKN